MESSVKGSVMVFVWLRDERGSVWWVDNSQTVMLSCAHTGMQTFKKAFMCFLKNIVYTHLKNI